MISPDNNFRFLPTKFPAATGAQGSTVTVGNEDIVLASTTGASINTLISSAAADIDNPGESDWYDAADLSGEYFISLYSSNSYFGLTVDPNEDADDALRMQIIIDGTTVCDLKSVKNAGGNATTLTYLIANSTTTVFFYCESSFKIRYAREGTMADAGSQVYPITVRYWDV